VANHGSNDLTKLRASDGTLLGTFHVGTGPAGVIFDGAYIWVVNHGNNNVVKVQPSDGSIIGNFAVGQGPKFIAFDGTNIWVTNEDTNNVTKLRVSDGMVQGTFAVGSAPEGLAFDGSSVWVANSEDDTVTKLRASDGTVLGTFSVGDEPYGVGFDGVSIWVANENSNNVSKLSPKSGSLQGTFNVGLAPYAVAFDGANIWVANTLSNNVSKLYLPRPPGSYRSFRAGVMCLRALILSIAPPSLTIGVNSLGNVDLSGIAHTYEKPGQNPARNCPRTSTALWNCHRPSLIGLISWHRDVGAEQVNHMAARRDCMEQLLFCPLLRASVIAECAESPAMAAGGCVGPHPGS
jgi:hypothetical protein